MKIFKFILSTMFIILGCIDSYLLYSLNVLPTLYLVLMIVGINILNIGALICLFLIPKWTRIISGVNYFIVAVITFFIFFFGLDFINFKEKGFNNYTKEITTYNVMVLSSSSYNKLLDITGEVGYVNDNIISTKKDLDLNLVEYSDVLTMYIDLKEEKIDAMIIDESYIDIVIDSFVDFESVTKKIYSFKIESEKKKKNTEVVSLKPINIYISGSDSRSDTIYGKSRSDANLILSLNPKTHKILLTSIPRDYYVHVAGRDPNELKEKLTHAGVYGLDVSAQTVAELFNIDISYSIKVGFRAVESIVDEIDGINIDSDTSFDSYHIKGWHVKKGVQHMDGAHALAYARERYAYEEGDRHRAQNQAQVINAIIDKFTNNKSLLLKSTDILNKLTSYYITDIPSELIELYIKDQIDNMNGWTVEVQSVSGKDAYDYCFIGNALRYVMYPNEQDVLNATEAIKKLLNE